MQLLISPFRLAINTKGVLLGIGTGREGADFYCIINSWATERRCSAAARDREMINISTFSRCGREIRSNLAALKRDLFACNELLSLFGGGAAEERLVRLIVFVCHHDQGHRHVSLETLLISFAT